MIEEYCRCPGCGDCGGRDKAAKLAKENKTLKEMYKKEVLNKTLVLLPQIEQQAKEIESLKAELEVLRIVSDAYELRA